MEILFWEDCGHQHRCFPSWWGHWDYSKPRSGQHEHLLQWDFYPLAFSQSYQALPWVFSWSMCLFVAEELVFIAMIGVSLYGNSQSISFPQRPDSGNHLKAFKKEGYACFKANFRVCVLFLYFYVLNFPLVFFPHLHEISAIQYFLGLLVSTLNMNWLSFLMGLDILVVLTEDVLDPNIPQLIEDVFTSICYMFKYLQRSLVRDFDNLFPYVFI